jgi:F-type H+-transporting ATPase subunit delta
MQTGGLAKRYAKALMNTAATEDALERAAEEIRIVAGFCSGKNDLVISLRSPLVTAPLKKKIISGLLAGKTLPLTTAFLCLLIEKKRFELLSSISAELDELIRAREGIARVDVASALPVDEAESEYLKRRLEHWLGLQVEISLKHDPALLCGIQVRVGDRFFDGSGSGKLAQIRAFLSAS